jgi:small GTP-binding protein
VDARKICILGDFAVGKTSLMHRFVHQQFSEKYLTTVGVKVDTKPVDLGDGRGVKLAIWDIAGTDTPSDLFQRYVRGASGHLLVADATRGETLSCCAELYDSVAAQSGPVPYVLLINKCDLSDQLEIRAAEVSDRFSSATARLDTSALTGANVDFAFETLARALLDSTR